MEPGWVKQKQKLVHDSVNRPSVNPPAAFLSFLVGVVVRERSRC